MHDDDTRFDVTQAMERKISSKDMISLPKDFRHILHIDPHTADPETLSQLLKGNKTLEDELEFEYDAEEENKDQDQEDFATDPSAQDYPKGIRPHRPSNRVRKSMISRPTNFQHVNHISAGERLDAPSSPPPLEPTTGDPQDWKDESTGGVRTRDSDSDLDLEIAYYRIPPPPPRITQNDVTNHYQTPQPVSHQVIERERRREEEEEEEVVRWRDERRDTWRETSMERERESCPPPLPSSPPPPIPSLPPLSLARKKSIGRPTNFQHIKHLDPETADRLLEECGEERGFKKDGERRRGMEREREREKRPPSLPPPVPHVAPPQDPQPQGKIRKSMIGHPTNFQHVAHIGLGGMEEKV